MLAMSTLTSRSPGRYVRMSATIGARDRVAAAGRGEGRGQAATPDRRRRIGRQCGGGQQVELVVGIERRAGRLVERRHPAQVARRGRLADILEEPLDLAEPGLRPRRDRQDAGHRPARARAAGLREAVETARSARGRGIGRSRRTARRRRRRSGPPSPPGGSRARRTTSAGPSCRRTARRTARPGPAASPTPWARR